MVVLEAFAHGVPVVATDAPGPANIITHGRDGWLVQKNNPQALASGLHQVAINTELAAGLAEEGWKTVQSYGFQSVADKWDDTINQICHCEEAKGRRGNPVNRK